MKLEQFINIISGLKLNVKFDRENNRFILDTTHGLIGNRFTNIEKGDIKYDPFIDINVICVDEYSDKELGTYSAKCYKIEYDNLTRFGESKFISIHIDKSSNFITNDINCYTYKISLPFQTPTRIKSIQNDNSIDINETKQSNVILTLSIFNTVLLIIILIIIFVIFYKTNK